MAQSTPKTKSNFDRLNLRIDANIPAANQYTLPSTFGKVPDKRSSAAFTMSGRLKPQVDEKSPGPAKYNVTNTDQYKVSQPKYTMAPRITRKTVKAPLPGPGAYNPKLPSRGPAGYTFGSRTKAVPLITAADTVW